MLMRMKKIFFSAFCQPENWAEHNERMDRFGYWFGLVRYGFVGRTDDENQNKGILDAELRYNRLNGRICGDKILNTHKSNFYSALELF